MCGNESIFDFEQYNLCNMHKNIPIYFRCFSILFCTQQYVNNPQKTHDKNSTKWIHNVSQK